MAAGVYRKALAELVAGGESLFKGAPVCRSRPVQEARRRSAGRRFSCGPDSIKPRCRAASYIDCILKGQKSSSAGSDQVRDSAAPLRRCEAAAIAEAEQDADLQAAGHRQQAPRLVRTHHQRDLLRSEEHTSELQS